MSLPQLSSDDAVSSPMPKRLVLARYMMISLFSLPLTGVPGAALGRVLPSLVGCVAPLVALALREVPVREVPDDAVGDDAARDRRQPEGAVAGDADVLADGLL